MNIYLLSQSENTGYDTFNSCVVIATNENDARELHPLAEEEDIIINNNRWYIEDESEKKFFPCIDDRIEYLSECHGWTTYDTRHNVTVKKIGVAELGAVKSVVLASYRAG